MTDILAKYHASHDCKPAKCACKCGCTQMLGCTYMTDLCAVCHLAWIRDEDDEVIHEPINIQRDQPCNQTGTTGALANVTREQRRQLDRDNARQPVVMTRVPESTWPVNVAMSPGRPQEVWRSRYFLAQVFKTRDGLRITIGRTSVNTSTGRWQDEISWDELMSVKREIGRGSRWAYECYPADADVVNVANMRHLWVPDIPPSFGWHS